MLAASEAVERAAPKRPRARRPHDPAKPYLVPPIAEGHNDPIVRAAVATFTVLYGRRGSLRHALLNHLGDLIFPAVPELLRRNPDHQSACPFKGRPGKRAGGCDCPPVGPDLPRRRSGGIEALVRVLLVLVSCCDWVSMRLIDPKGGYLSVWRIAELADLPCYLTAPRQNEDPRRRRHQMSTVERVLQILRTARIIVYTEQHREELLDGRHTSTGPAIRKLSVSFFKKFGGELAQVFTWRRQKLIEKAEKRKQKAFAAGVGTDLSVTSLLHRMETATKPNLEPAEASPDGAPWSPIPIEITDQVYSEHPEWTLGEINAEARRRMRAPPSSSSREPSSDE